LERLRRKTDLDKVFQDGRRFYSPAANQPRQADEPALAKAASNARPWVVLQARRRRPEEATHTGPRLAVIAGRQFQNAVARNRARRLLRETCRTALGENQGPWDLVLIARVDVLSVPFPERLSVLTSLLRQAGVLSEEAAAA